jgi:aminoglycoside phosphotransferase (APT) family kinase protein
MSGGFTDQARPVRAGEELDVAKLAPWLRAALGAPADAPLGIAQFPAGHSNLTYLLTLGDRELVLRRPPFGSKVKSAHDMGREYKILSKLSAVYPPAPKPLAACEDVEILGAPFYVMARIPGLILRKTIPRGLTIDRATAEQMSRAMIDNLAAIHAIDARAIGLGDLGKPEGYVERQVVGWTKRYADSRTHDLPAIDRIAAWLAAHLPPDHPDRATLIHNDYKYDNVVLAADDLTKIVGVLDWEMSTIGDPLMDLGTFLNYWIGPDDDEELRSLAFGPTSAPGSLDRRALVDRYAEITGRDVSGILFHYTFALFKTAVVLQQIYFRYAKGLTKDERFATLHDAVGILARAVERALAAGRIG